VPGEYESPPPRRAFAAGAPAPRLRTLGAAALADSSSTSGSAATSNGGSGGSGSGGGFQGEDEAKQLVSGVRRVAGEAGASKSAAFCNGEETSMYMTGFTSVFSSSRSNRPCAVFLFEGLVLDTPGKFVFGCWFSCALGVAIEGALAVGRRVPVTTFASGGVKMFLHALTLSLGYALMLLVMVYSVEITVSAILGLCIGRLLFGALLGGSAPMALGPLEDEKRTACCLD